MLYKKKYNHIRSQGIVGGPLLLAFVIGIATWSLQSRPEGRPVNTELFIFVAFIYGGMAFYACVIFVMGLRQKAFAIIDSHGILVQTKNAPLSFLSWDRVSSCKFYHQWSGAVSTSGYMVLFMCNVITQDIYTKNYRKHLLDKYMDALYRKKMTKEEFDELKIISFWVDSENDYCKIKDMIDNRKTGDATLP